MDRTSRDRDKGRKYKPGNVKRKKKAEATEMIGKLPTITQWFQSQSVSVPP